MIKELLKSGSHTYYSGVKEEKEIIFSIWHFGEEKSITEIEEGLKVATLPDYYPVTLSEILEKPLPLFQLNIYSFGSTLESRNMSLYEYERLIKNNQVAEKALKMAFIQNNNDSVCFYVACESFDNESMVNRKNMDVVRSYLYNRNGITELEKVINKEFSHVEAY
jgi:peptide subunit release factor RF-3